jgi:hypothetical protein
MKRIILFTVFLAGITFTALAQDPDPTPVKFDLSSILNVVLSVVSIFAVGLMTKAKGIGKKAVALGREAIDVGEASLDIANATLIALEDNKLDNIERIDLKTKAERLKREVTEVGTAFRTLIGK